MYTILMNRDHLSLLLVLPINWLVLVLQIREYSRKRVFISLGIYTFIISWHVVISKYRHMFEELFFNSFLAAFMIHCLIGQTPIFINVCSCLIQKLDYLRSILYIAYHFSRSKCICLYFCSLFINLMLFNNVYCNSDWFRLSLLLIFSWYY